MFTADGPARIGAGFEDFRCRLLHPRFFLRVPFIKHDEGMQVAVARMKHIADGQIVFLTYGDDLGEYLGQFGSGTVPSQHW